MKKLTISVLALLLLAVTACSGQTDSTPRTPAAPVDITPIPIDAACRAVPPVGAWDYTLGLDDAPITLIEYAEFQCPGCARFEPVLHNLLDYRSDVRFAFRFFPLSYHDKAIITAEAALAAGEQGAFWEMHGLLFERYNDWAQLAPDAMPDLLTDYARELGLDVNRFAAALENGTYQPRVEAAFQEAGAIRAPGTPTFIINGRMYPFGLGLSAEAMSMFMDLSLDLPPAYDSTPPQMVDTSRSYRAIIRTARGDIVIELYPDQAPNNVNSFVFLAQEGWYDGITFFHVIPDAVALTGDPTNTGFIMDQGFWCDIEIAPDLSFDQAGMVGLNGATQRTTSSQFFITLAPQPEWTGSFTIIGRVVEGMDVVQSLTPRNNQDPDAPPGDVIETIVIEER